MTSSSEQPKENPPMICASFHRLSIVQPENCYNCVHRHGYPQYLFGDENCDSFIDTRSRPHPAPARDFVDTPEKPWCYPGCMLVCNAKVEAARKVREEAYDKFLDEIRKEEYDNCGYVDMDSVEAVYVRLRSTTTPRTEQEQPR